MGHDLLLVNRKIPIKNIEHLAFHPTDVPWVENTGTPRPNDVFHHLIIEVLRSEWNQHNELMHDVTANKSLGRRDSLCQRAQELQRRSFRRPSVRWLSVSGASPA